MAQLTCKNCGAPIPAENINIQKTLAVCPECATVFDFSSTVEAAAPAPHKRKRRKTKQPEHITIQPSASGLDLVYKWGLKAEVPSNLFWMALWAIISLAIGLGGTLFAGEPGAWAATLVIGAAPLYYFLCLFTNATRFLLDEDQLQVRTTPLWFWGAGHATVDTSDIEAVYWELGEDDDEEDEDSYLVYARLRDGGRKKLFEGIRKQDAEFIAQELNAALYEQEMGDYAHLTDAEGELDPVLIEAEARRSRRTKG
jgi:hypothetical protein